MRLLFVGFGTVGQGLAELLLEKKEILTKEFGLTWQTVGILDKKLGNVVAPEGLDLQEALTAAQNQKLLEGVRGERISGEATELISGLEADVLIEVTYTDIKTGEPAVTHIRQALEKGMHVVTTNKGPVALFYEELIDIARANNVHFLFEGTVMSGTPVLNLFRETLSGCEFQEIKGILNGTTNYILTRMEEGLSYEDALKKAQEFGYAEAVPDADVLGWDALAKVTILAKVVFGSRAKPFDFPCEGITSITSSAVVNALSRGKRFKLIGRVWRERNLVKAEVAPEEIDINHPLGSVMGATNALTILTDSLGEITVIGPGAGRRETGYSLLNDLLKIAREQAR
ncbi:MAG: homoserine dehydrogenase [Candidatus Aminicenantes bacterium 4484_214]|nr:MAG: homoserine dehydrogenase [Candidatus Aminicenantes bacterium 4484_214]RLE10068.1 MAG: homoserine dehydrogenase [Candidatus Aminicenantes bacterium]